jgi:hypothetical protein
LVIEEAQHAHAKLPQNLVTASIAVRLKRLEVLAAVELDGKPCAGTVEVEDEAAARVLPAKFAAELLSAKELPEKGLGVRRPATHLSGEETEIERQS